MAKSTQAQPPTDQTLLGQTRAQYGEQIVSTLSTQLVPTYGKGFSERMQSHLHRAVLLSRERQARGNDNADKQRDGQS